MKHLKLLLPLFLFALLTACDNDDDTTETPPPPVVEEEVITTLTAVLTPTTTGPAITLQSKDLDGDGPTPPVVTISGELAENTEYNGKITLLNETEDPAEDITEEVEEESNEHQFFYTIGSGLDLTVVATNNDENGNPLGTEFSLTTTTTGSGTLTFTLRHEPTKPNDGTLGDAGGETDISVPFDIEIL